MATKLYIQYLFLLSSTLYAFLKKQKKFYYICACIPSYNTSVLVCDLGKQVLSTIIDDSNVHRFYDVMKANIYDFWDQVFLSSICA